MKPLTFFIGAVMASFSCVAQNGPPSGAPVSGSRVIPLNSGDSLVLAEIDSAATADSILRSRVRTVLFPDAIDAVLGDLPYNLRHVTGELLLAEGEIDNYASLVVIADAQNCVVTRYHSVVDTTASWQAKMYSTEDFGAAARKYQQLYTQLKTCNVRMPDGSIYLLDGSWEPAREGISFTTCTLRVKTEDWRFRDVMVQLELVYQMADWAVNINIVTKRRDDEVGAPAGR
jgi:hypothetical protein